MSVSQVATGDSNFTPAVACTNPSGLTFAAVIASTDDCKAPASSAGHINESNHETPRKVIRTMKVRGRQVRYLPFGLHSLAAHQEFSQWR